VTIAEWMLLEHRSRIERLALVAQGGLGREVNLWMRLGTFPLVGPAFTPVVMYLSLPVVLRLCAATFGHVEPDEARRAVKMSRLPGTARAFRRTLGGVVNVFGQYLHMLDRAGEVPNLPPIALYWGTDDEVIPCAHGRRVLGRLGGATLNTYPKSGHYPHLDAPLDFAEDLEAFLTDLDRPPVRLLEAPERRRLFSLRRSRSEPSGSGVVVARQQSART